MGQDPSKEVSEAFKHLGQGSTLLLDRYHTAAQIRFQPQSNTPEPANQGVQSFLIITGRCARAGLELMSAGGIPESRLCDISR